MCGASVKSGLCSVTQLMKHSLFVVLWTRRILHQAFWFVLCAFNVATLNAQETPTVQNEFELKLDFLLLLFF